MPCTPSLPPQVLGSILGALKGIINVIGMSRMTPPIKELLPRLTPILRNRWAVGERACVLCGFASVWLGGV